ncbi:MAG: DUF2804 domain-containing protein [Treponema sp.]|nr:DUF2804 domain-containing protein [Treponema sp.]
MYTREIQPPRDTPVENGIPVQGTWDRAFKEVNLLDIHRPYRTPLPGWARDYRIKEWQRFAAQDDRYFFAALLANFKLYCFAQIHLYDKEKGESYQFKKLLPGKGWWRLPRNLANASAGSLSKRFFFLIHNWLDADSTMLDVDIEAERGKSILTVYLGYNINKDKINPMAVSLCFSEHRSMYAFKAAAPVHGDIVFMGKRITMEPERTTGIFCDYKGFFPYRMRNVMCSSMGFSADGRRFGFHLGENQAKETNRNNENALWTDGRVTPLPPVRITMPKGADSNWIIQDMEGMVDLVFTPKVNHNDNFNMLITSADYNTPLGHYNGMVVNSDGEKIQVHNMLGMGEILHLRM